MASHEYEYLIALGSNTGDRINFLNRAVEAVHNQIGPVARLSTIIETEPVGAADSLFLNAAVRVLSNLNPDKVMSILLSIEKNLGRERTERWGNRTIDLDILLVRTRDRKRQLIQAVVDSSTLTIPHPEMLNRDFVMIPAAQIAPDWTHPKTNSTLAEEAARFEYRRQDQTVSWDFKGPVASAGNPINDGPSPTFI